MSSHSQSNPGPLAIRLVALVVALCFLGDLARAQEQPPPKVEIFGGYSFIYPNTRLHAINPIVDANQESNPRGVGASLTYNFNSWFGLTVDFSGTLWGSGETPAQLTLLDDARFYNASFGPKLTYRRKHFAPFAEGLVGWHRLTEDHVPLVGSSDKFGFMLGGGVDAPISTHFGLRLLRADFVFSNHQFPPAGVRSTDVRGVRLQTGVNFMFGGGAPPVSPSAACSVQPTEVFAGEPVTATANASNFNPKRTVKYNWNGTGVKVAGSDASTQIDTTGLQPGSYGVTANLSDGSKNGFASCSARFTVKEPRPPVISCSADPGSVRAGGTSTINSNASSPDGRRLTYSYTTSAGNITGNTSTATLDSRDAQPGTITVTCNVSDDRNPPLTASSTTTVNVEATPEIKQLEAKLALHSIYFQTARPTAENPEGGLVDSQAEILKTLAADFKQYLQYRPDAHLILSGHADPRGTVEYNKALTQRRVDRTKNVLVENGVPENHIETRSFGKEDQLTADQIKELIAQDPDLSPADRQQMLNNLPVMVLANNRRVDVTLSTTGQQSTRLYPFNAKDFLALISTKGVGKKPPVKKKPRR